MRPQLLLGILIISSLIVLPVLGSNENVVYFPISDITVSPGDSNLISDEMDSPIIEVTAFDFSIPSFVELFLDTFHIHNVPVWAAETIVILIGIITTVITLITSGSILLLYTRHKLAENPESRRMIILAYLTENPGAQQKDIVQNTGYSRGSVSHHLRQLIRGLKIYQVENDVVRYYPIGYPASELNSDARKLLENENRKRIFQTILHHPGISQKQIFADTHIPITTLRWHLKKMQKGNLILVESNHHKTSYSVNPAIQVLDNAQYL